MTSPDSESLAEGIVTAALVMDRSGDAEPSDVHEQLREALETLRAIRHGEVDALVVSNGAHGEQVYTLDSADRPYRIFVENMQEGAATLSDNGVVLFANERLGRLLECPTSSIVARNLTEFVAESSRPALLDAIGSTDVGAAIELDLLRPDGGVVAALVGVSALEVDDERLTCLTFTDLTSEHRFLSEARDSQQRFEALYKGAPVPAYTWQDGASGLVLIDYNDAAARLSDGIVAQSMNSLATDYYRTEPQLLADLTRCLTETAVVDREVVIPRTPSADEQYLQITMVPVPPDMVVVHTQDTTQRRVAELALRSSEERYRTIVEYAQEGISIVDDEGVFTFANRRTAELLELEVSALVGMNASQLFDTSFGEALALRGEPRIAQYEVSAPRPDGTTIDLLLSTAPILLPSGGAGSLCMMTDVSGLRQAEERLAHWAMHDSLTGLPNRTLLMDRISQALTRSHRTTGTVAALFCDLDGFKEVNDSFGHHVGDDVLRAASARLLAAVRPGDTVARIGGDEFVVLCEGMLDETAAFGLTSRVLESISQPLTVSGHTIPLSVSVGVAFALSDDAGELLRNADAAMYLAKQLGRNRAELFDERQRQVAAERISLIADLRLAARHDELRVHYQPVVSLVDEHLLGVEALVRWQHPVLGLLPPDSFIQLAETASVIGEIGAWVLKTACRQAALWAHSGVGGTPLKMAVNVSARQLAQGSDLVQLVASAIEDSKIDPSTLVLEVTETAVMDDAEAALGILTDLKRLGVQLSIDDFGTGYSSLVYLKRFPVDQLKVDRTFVGGIGDDPDDAAIVASVIGLAHAVGIEATAEGVETPEQLISLQRLGCSYGQGYLWSRPKPAADIDLLMLSGSLALHDPAERQVAT